MKALCLHRIPSLALRRQASLRPSTHRGISQLVPRMQAQNEGEKGESSANVPARRSEQQSGALYDPFADVGFPAFGRMSSLLDEFNQLARAFGMPTMLEAVPGAGAVSRAAARPLAVDIRDAGDKIEVKADVPGIPCENIKISVSPDNVLTLSAERKSEVKEGSEEEGTLRVERSYGSFMRRFRLPDNVDADAIKARVKGGELYLTIPKTEAKAPEHKTIQVSPE